MYPWDGKNVYFMGFMATGKSKVGQAFADLLGWPFYDTDSLIEERAGKTISDIFEQDGEAHFRALEAQVIEEISRKRGQVVSLGGGAVISDDNWRRIVDSGLTICLYASPELLYERISRKDHRPLMKDYDEAQLLEQIKRLLAAREPYYRRAQYFFESRADVTAETLAERIFKELMDEI